MKLWIVLLPLIESLIKASRYGKKIFPPIVMLFNIQGKKAFTAQFREGVVICTCRLAMCNDIGDMQKESKHRFICLYFL